MSFFSLLVRAGSLSAAARELNLTTAGVSKRLAQLEARLGVRLLQRTTRRVTVTPEGRDYYEKTGRILADLEEIDTSFDIARGKPRGQLRIDIGSSTASDVLLPALPEFLARYPDIRIELGVSDRAADLIADNVDCVIRGGALNDSSLVARSIGRATMVTCAAPSYLKQFGTPAYPDELKNGHRLVSYVLTTNGRALPFRFARGGESVEIKVEHRVGINESNAHLAAAVAGLGIVQTFSYCAGKHLRDGSLVEILADWRPAGFPFHVVYPQNRHLTQRLRVFIDWLAERFPQRVSE